MFIEPTGLHKHWRSCRYDWFNDLLDLGVLEYLKSECTETSARTSKWHHKRALEHGNCRVVSSNPTMMQCMSWNEQCRLPVKTGETGWSFNFLVQALGWKSLVLTDDRMLIYRSCSRCSFLQIAITYIHCWRNRHLTVTTSVPTIVDNSEI